MTPLHGIACFCDIGFGARAVSRKTPIFFLLSYVFLDLFFNEIQVWKQARLLGLAHPVGQGGLGLWGIWGPRFFPQQCWGKKSGPPIAPS